MSGAPTATGRANGLGPTPSQTATVPASVRNLAAMTKVLKAEVERRQAELQRGGGQVVCQVLRGRPLDDDPLRDPCHDPLSSRRARVVDLAHDPRLIEAARLVCEVLDELGRPFTT